MSDLRAIARHSPSETLFRIAAGAPVADAVTVLQRVILTDGSRLAGDDAQALHSALLLAATLPDDDFEAFQTATAILLADRLQQGGGTDDLFWHWDAFQQHYAIAVPAVRAALCAGYRQLDETGLVDLYEKPSRALLLSQPRHIVFDRLRGVEVVDGPTIPAGLAVRLAGALEPDEDLDELSTTWREHGAGILGAPDPTRSALVAGFRYIHETRWDWRPFGNRKFGLDDAPPVLLPMPLG